MHLEDTFEGSGGTVVEKGQRFRYTDTFATDDWNASKDEYVYFDAIAISAEAIRRSRLGNRSELLANVAVLYLSLSDLDPKCQTRPFTISAALPLRSRARSSVTERTTR